MIIKLSNGKTIVLDDIAKDPKAEGMAWLRKYRARKELEARRQAAPGSPPAPPLGGLTLENKNKTGDGERGEVPHGGSRGESERRIEDV